MSIRRAFTTAWLPGRDSLCGSAIAGSATAAGGEGLETRFRGWRWLVYPIWTLGLEENGRAVDPHVGECQSPKRALLGAIQIPVIVGEHGFPEVAQVSVVRIGSAWLAAVPVELTTIAGLRVRNAIREAALAGGETVSHTTLIGLANGFLQYVTTAEEYAWQSYEGGSNLYGPGMQGFLARRAATLAREIATAGRDSSPPVVIPLITAYPGPPSEIMSSFGPRVVDTTARQVEFRCEGGRLVGRWADAAPGRIFPLTGPWIALERSENGADWQRIGKDGDGRLEVHADGGGKSGEFRWRVVWRQPAAESFYRLVRFGPDGRILWSSGHVPGTGGRLWCEAR